MSIDLIESVPAVPSLPAQKTQEEQKQPQEASEAAKAEKKGQVEAKKEPPPTPKSAAKSEELPSAEDVAQRLSERLAEVQQHGYLRELRFEYGAQRKGVISLKILDARTDKVLREIPPEDQLEYAEKLERFLGLLLDEQV